MRADEQTHGHEIGLAVVSEIVRLSGGEIKTKTSQLGGFVTGAYLTDIILSYVLPTARKRIKLDT